MNQYYPKTDNQEEVLKEICKKKRSSWWLHKTSWRVIYST